MVASNDIWNSINIFVLILQLVVDPYFRYHKPRFVSIFCCHKANKSKGLWLHSQRNFTIPWYNFRERRMYLELSEVET